MYTTMARRVVNRADRGSALEAVSVDTNLGRYHRLHCRVPWQGAGKGKASHDGIQGLGLELESDSGDHVSHLYYFKRKKYDGSQGSQFSRESESS